MFTYVLTEDAKNILVQNGMKLLHEKEKGNGSWDMYWAVFSGSLNELPLSDEEKDALKDTLREDYFITDTLYFKR